MEAVARELVRRDIVADVAGLCALSQQISDERPKVLLRSGDVLASMQQCRELGAVVLMLNERVGLEHSFEPLASAASLVSELGELGEIAGDLTFVPGEQDCFEVWEAEARPLAASK